MSGLQGARKNRKFLPIIGVATAAAALLLAGCPADGRDRRVFLFYAAAPLSASSNNPIREVRYLAAEGRDPLAVFLADLLLGSSGKEHVQPFASKCELARCFARGSAAYIDIAASDLEKTVSDPLFSDKCALFKKNVFTNFKNIDTIYLYFDGVEVYAEKH